jgi:hypothetical protein
MKTTIDLPDELIREAKLRTVMQGLTLRVLIGGFIRHGLSTAVTLDRDFKRYVGQGLALTLLRQPA